MDDFREWLVRVLICVVIGAGGSLWGAFNIQKSMVEDCESAGQFMAGHRVYLCQPKGGK